MKRKDNMKNYIPKVGEKIIASRWLKSRKIRCIVVRIDHEPVNKGTDMEYFYVCKPLETVNWETTITPDDMDTNNDGTVGLVVGEMSPIS